MVISLPEEPLPPPPKIGADRKIPPLADDDAMERFEPELDALDFWESLESMRVEVPAGTVVGPLRSFGEFVLLPDGAEAGERSARGGIFFREGGPDLDRIAVGRRLAGDAPEVQVGDRIESPFVGIVDYGFSAFRYSELVLVSRPLVPRIRLPNGAKPWPHGGPQL